MMQVLRKRRLIFLLAPLCAVLLTALSLQAAGDQGGRTVFEEKFDGKLREGWTWVRELPSAWKIENGQLILTVQPSYLHPYGKELRNLLVRETPADLGANWAVEVKLDSDPTVQYEHAGVLLYWDDDNYIGLFRESLGGKPKLQFVDTKKASGKYAVVDNSVHPVWVRVEIHGEDLTTQYRTSEKDEWRTVGKTKLVAGKPRCGLISGGAKKDAHHEARFSDFRIEQLPAGPSAKSP